jgi:hypothetical protein
MIKASIDPHSLLQQFHQLQNRLLLRMTNGIPIQPHDLLLMGDDPSFYGSYARIGTQAAFRVHIRLRKQLLELLSCDVSPDDSEEISGDAESREISSHICGSPRHKALSLQLNHGYGRLWRDSSHGSPDELVQHDVTKHENPFP